MAKYPDAMPHKEVHACRVFRNVGIAEGIIIASHMSWKVMAEPNQVWPRIRIHIMDKVHPPGISISQHIERQK